MENYRYLNYYNVMVVTQRKRYFEKANLATFACEIKA